MSDIQIYVKEGCPYCAAAMKHYTGQGKEFEQIDIHRTPGAKDKLLKLTGGQKIVPVIVDHGDVHIGFGGG